MQEKETKHERFLRLATSRTQNVLTAMGRLKNCANVTTYAYTPAEIERIYAAIDEAYAELKAAYAERPKAKPKVFTLLDVGSDVQSEDSEPSGEELRGEEYWANAGDE